LLPYILQNPKNHPMLQMFHQKLLLHLYLLYLLLSNLFFS
jgi:hypothetical protein